MKSASLGEEPPAVAPDTDSKAKPVEADRPKEKPVRFLMLMVVYLLVNHGLTVGFGPTAHDGLLLAASDGSANAMVTLVGGLWALFGASAPPYHIVNLALLYGCMVAVFFLTRLVVKGPWWLGSLTAVLLMANPLKTDAVASITGTYHLVPAFFALWALCFYALHVERRRAWLLLVAWGSFCAAVGVHPANTGLVFAVVLYEIVLVQPPKRNLWRLIPFVVMDRVGWYHSELTVPGWHELTGLAPLSLIFYPIGYLPETVEIFQSHPVTAWLAALAWVAVLAVIGSGARHRAFVFGVGGALAIRLMQFDAPVDLATMEGGGVLLVSIALVNIAFAAVCWRIMQHRKWVKPVVFLTTVLCVVFFILQIKANLAWGQALPEPPPWPLLPGAS